MAGLVGPAQADALSYDPFAVGGRRAGAYTFANPLYGGADPWVVRHGRSYYLCQAGRGNRIEVWKSPTLTRRGDRRIAWVAPPRGWNRTQVWAPELHLVRGRWHIYYAASDGRNANHRMGVLRATTDDPQGPYVDAGQLYTGDDATTARRSRWAIDGTVFELRDRLYFLWSGWEDERDVQHLYIAPMSDPCTVGGNRVRVCPNDCHPWERVGEHHGERGLHEGPQILHRHGKLFLVYSCSGSWQPTYKLGLLYMDEKADPMQSGSWKKHHEPVFDSTCGVFGVGHCCFTESPDGTEDWILYHSKRHRWDSWTRDVRAQKFTWREDGFPDFGRPAPTGEPLAMPSGDEAVSPSALPVPAAAAPPEAA